MPIRRQWIWTASLRRTNNPTQPVGGRFHKGSTGVWMPGSPRIQIKHPSCHVIVSFLLSSSVSVWSRKLFYSFISLCFSSSLTLSLTQLSSFSPILYPLHGSYIAQHHQQLSSVKVIDFSVFLSFFLLLVANCDYDSSSLSEWVSVEAPRFSV